MVKRVLERCGWKDPSLGPWEWKGHSEALCGGLKKWTPNLLVYGVGPALWLCHHYNTSSMQFSHYKIRKTAFFVVKGCLHYFCPIKYLLVRAFLVLCLVGLGFSLPAISFFSSLKPSASIFQPNLAVPRNAQVHSDTSGVPKANTTLRVISHSQEDTGSPPWIAVPLLQNYYSVFLSRCSPFFRGYLSPSFLKAD